jgi:hypothetical protein
VRNQVGAMMLTVTADDPVAPHKKTLEELKSEAIAKLECRGYDIRGKTPTQIRQILKRRPRRRDPTLGHIAGLRDS